MRGSALVGSILLAAGVAAGASGSAAQEPPAQPNLIVLVVVDQLRADMIDTFAPAFDGGLRRFLDRGYRFTNASHGHAVTQTAAGHATISTGVFPSRSGIVANDWQQRQGVRWVAMYSVEDREAEILGADWAAGRSPENLLRTGLADWVRATSSDARVASISGKDRAAITLAGKSQSEVYWLLHQAGAFVTSDYYRRRYPGWVAGFNRDVMPEILADTVWDSVVPSEHRALARPDSAAYEGDGVNTAFPHVAAAEIDTTEPALFNIWALEQPRADRAVLELSRIAVEELDLGTRDAVDFLAISLSAADYVGHAYGPLSQEQLDNLVRLDRELGAFLEYLDERVGEGEWIAALTGDHGIMTMPEHLQAQGDAEARRSDPREKRRVLSEALVESAREGGTQAEVAERLARVLEERGIVTRAYTHRQLTLGAPADSFATLYRNSHYPGRAHSVLSPYGLEFRYGYNELVRSSGGTTHGAPYWYDRHVPFMLLGAGIPAGSSDAPVYTVDIAPTLASLVGVTVPYDLDGTVVYRR